MGFEVFQKSSAPLAKVPSVTIQRRGLISLNRSAWALIDNTEFVELLYDPAARVIGLRPALATSPNAYPVRPQASNSTKGPVLIAGQMFTKYYGIDTEQAVRYLDPKVEDGILCVDLKAEGQRVTSNRNKSRGSSAIDDEDDAQDAASS